MRRFGWLLAVVLSACSVNRMPAVPLDPHSLSEAEIASVKGAVSARFKDPNSAQFEGLVAMRQANTVHVCGRVNAKNSYGGYGGFVPFWVDVDANTGYAVVMNSAVDANDMAYSIVRNQCGQFGLAVF